MLVQLELDYILDQLQQKSLKAHIFQEALHSKRRHLDDLVLKIHGLYFHHTLDPLKSLIPLTLRQHPFQPSLLH